MNNFRIDVLCSVITRAVQKTLYQYVQIIDKYNFKYSTYIKPRDIVITKSIPNVNGRSIKIYYIINGTAKDHRFFEISKGEIIRKLKKQIRKAKFPTIRFIYDDNYHNTIFNTTRVLKDLEIDKTLLEN